MSKVFQNKDKNLDNKILLIVGKSGCEKKRLQNKLIKEYGFSKPILYSTKPIDENSSDCENYVFVKSAEYSDMSKRRKFITSKTNTSVVGNSTIKTRSGYIKKGIDLSNGNYAIVVTIKELIRFYSHYDSEDIISINLESEYYTRCSRLMDSGMEVLDIIKLDDEEVININSKKAKGYTDRTFKNDETFDELLDKVLTYLKNRNVLI